jgi:hypothetical protein
MSDFFGFGQHPGPPPRVQPPEWHDCDHVGQPLRFVWRRFKYYDEATGDFFERPEPKWLRYGYQCKHCGRPAERMGWLGAAKSMEFHQQPLCEAVPYEDDFTREKAAERNAFYWKRRDDFNEAKRREFFDWYNRYLASSAWQEIRAAALARDGHACRGCSAPAAQVHHLTYARVGYEHLDDLLSVCVSCHEEIHRRPL